MTRRSLDERDGELLVLTDREGRAARMGHRLSIVMMRWHAEIEEQDGDPVSCSLGVAVAGLQVRSGEGGVKPLSSVEREVARRQALRTLGARQHPTIEFHGDRVVATGDRYEVDGGLTIHGVARPHRVTVHGNGELACETTVRQSDHGVRPVRFMMGALRVTDEVTIRWSATR